MVLLAPTNGKVISLTLVHPENALLPILVTVSGTTIFVKEELFRKAYVGILLSPEPILS